MKRQSESSERTTNNTASMDRTNQRVALSTAILASFMTPFMISSVNIALPVIGNEYSLNAGTLGWIATSYLLAAAMVLMPAGKLADIVGRKKFYAIGLGLYSGASFLCTLAASGPSLILFRIFQGFGAGVMFATGLAIVTSVFPIEKRGMALGIVAGATYLGLSVGPVVGGLLTHYLGWQSIFWSTAPVGLIALALVLLGLKGEWAEARRESFDLAGSIILAISLPAMIYGTSSLPSPLGILLLAAGSRYRTGCSTDHDGSGFTPGRQAFRQDRSSGAGFDRHGSCRPWARSAGLPGQPNSGWPSLWSL